MAKNWTTVQPSLEPILKPILAVIETIDSVLAFLIALLNIVQFILNIVKAFLIGLLNPIRAIIEAIIAEIRQIISDLRQAGLYIADDIEFLQTDPTDLTPKLLGGFDTYERRMLSRLLNRTDPTRPDFSSATAVVALFAYISSGDIFALIELLRRIAAFFGKRTGNKNAPFPAPTTPTAKVGTYGNPVVSFLAPTKLTGAPNAVQVAWTMPSTGTPFAKPPKGFLVHVSTVPDGFGVRAFKPNSQSDQGVKDLPTLAMVGIDPTNGAELRLYGGVCDIGFGDSPDVFTNNDVSDPHAPKLFFALDQNTPLIPPDELNKGDVPLGAATYYFDQPFAGLLPGGSSYSCTLKAEQLPQRIAVSSSGGTVTVSGEDADTWYVRVRPVTATYSRNSGLSGSPNAPQVFDPDRDAGKLNVLTKNDVLSATGIVLNPFVGTETSGLYGSASQSATFTIPSADQLDFIAATKTALAIAILVRPDLVEVVKDEDGNLQPEANTYGEGQSTGLESLSELLAKMRVRPSLYEESADPRTFADQVARKVNRLADQLFFAYNPSQGIVEALSEQVQTLTEFKFSDIDSGWPDLTILETLENTGPDGGFAGRPCGYAGDAKSRLRKGSTFAGSGQWLTRTPEFPQKYAAGTPIESLTLDIFGTDAFIEGQGWSDYCPVLFSLPSGRGPSSAYTLYIQYVRTLLMQHDGGEVLNAASSILNVTGAVMLRLNPGQWTAIRFLDEVLKPADALLTDIEAFLLAILDGLQGIIDKIIAYIEGIQARIFQLQALIEKIRALLASLTLFDLPSFSGLVLVEKGTDGIASALVTAGNKPFDGPAAYGGGAVVLFGGLPSVFLDLIALVLAGGDD